MPNWLMKQMQKAFLEKDNYQIKLLNQCWYFYRKNTARKQCFYFTIDSDTLPFCTSTPSTHTVTMSPTDTTSRGCLTN